MRIVLSTLYEGGGQKHELNDVSNISGNQFFNCRCRLNKYPSYSDALAV